jgi:glucose/arabinose dehydrogenase
MVLAPDGTLLVTGADRFRFYDSDSTASSTTSRTTPTSAAIFPDASCASTGWIDSQRQPVARAGNRAAAGTYAHGLRDPEGAAINPATGELWVADHGPQGGDEINIIRPAATTMAGRFLRQACDARRTDGEKRAGRQRRLVHERRRRTDLLLGSDIGTSGMMFYTGDRFPEWKGISSWADSPPSIWSVSW